MSVNATIGASHIKTMLIENNRLQCLNISENQIGNNGMQHITEGLYQSNTLVKLEVCQCDISVEGN